MAFVTPSDAVRIIREMFPGNAEHDFTGIQISRQSTVGFQVLSELIKNIPGELIVLESEDYQKWLAGVVALNALVERLSTGVPLTGNMDPILGFGKTPLALIVEALEKCPDSAPLEGTDELEFVKDDVLREGLRLDLSSAHKSFADREWKPATVMAGSVIEALLLSKILVIDKDLRHGAINELRKDEGFKKPNDDLNCWDLHELLSVAHKLGVITGDTRAQADLARDFRNFIHPGRSVRFQRICDQATALTALAAIHHVIRELRIGT